MITVKEPIKARKTCVGHYDFHYPDLDSPGASLKTNTKFVLNTWGPRDGLRAIAVREGDSTVVYWVDPRDIVDKCF